MPRLAIIIPWCDSQAAFEDTLVSVLQNRPNRSEILVLHSHPYHDPYRIADEGVSLVECQGATELALINTGLRMASSPIIHVLRCGMEVQANWAEPALACFNDPSVACVSPLLLERGKPDRLVSLGVGFSRGGERRVCGAGRQVRGLSEKLLGDVVGPTLAAGFYRSRDVLAVDGFDESVDQLADLDLALSLQTLGQQCVVSTESRVIGPAEPWLGGSFRIGRQLERMFWRHRPQPHGNFQLFCHACSIATRLLAQLPSPRLLAELCGRVAGMLERRHYSEFQQRQQAVADNAYSVHQLSDRGQPTKRQRLAA